MAAPATVSGELCPLCHCLRNGGGKARHNDKDTASQETCQSITGAFGVTSHSFRLFGPFAGAVQKIHTEGVGTMIVSIRAASLFMPQRLNAGPAVIPSACP